MATPFIRTLIAAVVCVLLGPVVLRVLTASAAAAPSSAGVGVGSVSGYAVSATQYVFSPDGQSIVGVGLLLDHPARDVEVSFLPLAWQACGASSPDAPYVVTCRLDMPVPAGDARHLAVLAQG